MTINDAIQKVLINEPDPLTVREIYEKIVSKGYYNFRAKNPASIVSAQLRRYTEGTNSKEAAREKLYRKTAESKFQLIGR